MGTIKPFLFAPDLHLHNRTLDHRLSHLHLAWPGLSDNCNGLLCGKSLFFFPPPGQMYVLACGHLIAIHPTGCGDDAQQYCPSVAMAMAMMLFSSSYVDDRGHRGGAIIGVRAWMDGPFIRRS